MGFGLSPKSCQITFLLSQGAIESGSKLVFRCTRFISTPITTPWNGVSRLTDYCPTRSGKFGLIFVSTLLKSIVESNIRQVRLKTRCTRRFRNPVHRTNHRVPPSLQYMHLWALSNHSMMYPSYLLGKKPNIYIYVLTTALAYFLMVSYRYIKLKELKEGFFLI